MKALVTIFGSLILGMSGIAFDGAQANAKALKDKKTVELPVGSAVLVPLGEQDDGCFFVEEDSQGKYLDPTLCDNVEDEIIAGGYHND